jgi:hypothetical protein
VSDWLLNLCTKFLRKSNVRIPSSIICFIGGFIFYLCYLYLFRCTCAKYNFHIWWCSSHLIVTWHVSLWNRKFAPFWNIGGYPQMSKRIRCAKSVALCVLFCWPLSFCSFSSGFSVICPCPTASADLTLANSSCIKPQRNDWIKHNVIVTRFIRRSHYQQIEDV